MEQLKRMQKVIDAWQSQAENTQQELASAHGKYKYKIQDSIDLYWWCLVSCGMMH